LKKLYDFIIIGSGLSGLLTAYRMANDVWFSDKSILILEKDNNKGNDRTWCFWEPSEGEFDSILSTTWNKAFIGNTSYKRTHKLDPYQYKMIRSADFYDFTKKIISSKSNIEILQETVVEWIETKEKIIIKGEKNSYESRKVLNSILNTNTLLNQNKYPYLKQHFIGWFIKTDIDIFEPSLVHFMDFTIPQKGNTRFMYVLPTSKKEALVEYTLFSENILTKEEYESALREYLFNLGIKNYEIIETEQGNIPMTCFPLHQKNTKRMIYIGTAGGWTKPSTGYTFYNSLKYSKQLTAFLKTKKNSNSFKITSRYWWYDLILLEVLHQHNEKGGELFGMMFEKINIKDIFTFLNEDGTLLSDLKIINAMPKGIFTLAFIRSFKKLIFN
jgi:lycopene beta-cyclase